MAEYGKALSERELEILQLVATGASNKEIAYQLEISTNTVKVHLRNTFAKLGAASRTEATMIAVREGWVDVPDTGEDATAAPELPPEPPLPWAQRVTLLVAAVLTVAIAALSWPGSTPSASSSAGLLPVGGGESQAGALGAQGESRWSERAQMPTRRAWLGLAASERWLYAVGGEGAEGISGEVEIYDLASDTWDRGAEKPTPAAYVAAVPLGGRILVPGGCIDSGQALNVVEVYDPVADAWETVAALPHPICAYAYAIHEGQLYVFGGTDGERYLATVFVYDPGQDRWEMRAPMGQARALAAAASLAGKIYVVGGYRDGRELTTCAVYDPAANTWAGCPPLTMARGGLGLVALGGRLYAVGGGGFGGYLGFNERLTPGGQRWTVVETPLTGSWQGAGVALSDLTVYAVGGYGDDYLSLNLAFDPFPFRIYIPTTER